jgi:hypothetical protein
MMNKDQVSWDRKALGATDELGHPSETSASGFPKEVRGNMQLAGSTKSQQSVGFVKVYDAVLFCEHFHEGQLNDRVSFGGVVYRVSKVVTRSNLMDSTARFSRYELMTATA